jgi:hypothetical protein
MTEFIDPSTDDEVYGPKQLSRLTGGVLMLASGALAAWIAAGGDVSGVVLALVPWLQAGVLPTGTILLCALILFAFGAFRVIEALRGLPRLVVAHDGIVLETLFGERWANWNSLDRFSFKVHNDGQGLPTFTASSIIIGQAVTKSILWRNKFRIPDAFAVPLSTLVAHLNARRDEALGTMRNRTFR